MMRESSRCASWGALVMLLAAACGGGGGDGSSSGSSGGSSSGGSSSPSAHGTLTVSVVPPEGSTAGYTSLAGKLYDGAYPSSVVWTKAAASSDGSCQLYIPSTPLCASDCGTGVCVATNTCQDYPSTISAGALTVTGVGTTPLTVNPISGSYARTVTDYPPFAEGATVSVAAAGATSGASAFSLGAKGITPLTSSLTTAAIARATSGYQALTLSWTAPTSTALATVHVLVDISHHGGIKGKIVCAAPDTGSLTIPATLVTQLVNLGVATSPTVELTRRTTGSATVGSGTVTLNVDSTVALPVTIEGITCSTGASCASGTCDTSTGLCQ